MPTPKLLSATIAHLRPCQPAVDWMDAQPAQRASVLWRDCQEPRWMLWIIGAAAAEDDTATRRKIVQCACRFARTTEHLWEDNRPGDAVVIAERWAGGDDSITGQQLNAAAYTAADAAADAAHCDIIREVFPRPPKVRRPRTDNKETCNG